ncbi:DUF2254 domain-containing protein [Alteriqipengyuania sp. 357]
MTIPVNYSARLGRIRMAVRQAFWIFPMIAIFAGILTATFVARLNFTTSASLGGLLSTGGPVGARNLVETVASTSLTVVTITFSVTIVALQVAAAQYSPRVPRQFIRDRATQLTLAVFIFTFVYCLAVLRSIREDTQVVPQFAVTLAFIFALISVAAFVYFIHHIVHAIRIEQILRNVEERTVEALGSNYERREKDDPEPRLPEIPDRAVPIMTTSSGIIQRINAELLLDYAAAQDLVIQYVYMLGDQAVKDTALAWVWTCDPDGRLPDPEGELGPRIAKTVQFGRERSVQADVAFGLTQLVDIALRAVSTAINDPTTACASIRSAEIVLVQLCKHRLGNLLLRDGDGVVRVAVPRRNFASYLDMVVTPLRRTCPADMAVMLRLSEMLADVGRAAVESDEQSEHVAHQMALVERAVARAVAEDEDVRKIGEAADAVETALSGKPPSVS